MRELRLGKRMRRAKAGWSCRATARHANAERDGGPVPSSQATAGESVDCQYEFFTMHPDLQNLIRLQDLDLAADRARRRIADMPAAQSALEARIAERTAAVTSV